MQWVRGNLSALTAGMNQKLTTFASSPSLPSLLQLLLRHNKLSGTRFVVLDGIEVPGTRGVTSLLNAVEIMFKVDVETATVTITPDLGAGGFIYR